MNLHRLQTGPLSVNTYILPLSKTEAIIVDPADCSFSGDEGSTLSFLKKNNFSSVAVVLTHGHFDHVSALPSLKKAFLNLLVAIHKDDSSYIGKDSGILQGKALFQMGFTEFIPFVSNLPEATHFLEDGKSLQEVFSDCNFSSEAKENLSTWEILHTPGHTEGSVCLYNESELTLLSGDTVFYHSWGRTDLIGGNEKKIRESLLHIMEYCDEESRVYSGHDGGEFILGENF